MSNTDLIKSLRALTQAGMKDCREALEEAEWDLQKAVDIVKTKGLNIADGRSGRIAAEGIVIVGSNHDLSVRTLVEVNSQTDFVANSPEFKKFACLVSGEFTSSVIDDVTFDSSSEKIEKARKDLVSTTKENIVVRRWYAEQSLSDDVYVFDYVHSNSKLGVLLTVVAPSEEAVHAPEFLDLGEQLAMQIAAMNPLAVSPDRLSPEEIERQRVIFETQLKELNKPIASWPKIMEGKIRKWNSEVCLLEQESVVVPKNTVRQVISAVETKLGGPITIVNFIRCQVGEGIETKKDDLAEEVAKLM